MKQTSRKIFRIGSVVIAALGLAAGGRMIWQNGQEKSLAVVRNEQVSQSPESLSSPPIPPSKLPQASATVILSAIEQLESKRDAKCHSSACRFENFMAGTPLTDEGRAERIRWQGQFVRWVWSAASQQARLANQSTVTQSQVDSIIGTVVRSEEDRDGNFQVSFGDQSPLAISKVRFRQYASIAYSLRAILSAQQESFLSDEKPLAGLDESAVEAIRHGLDLVTVGVLLKADRAARDHNISEIDQSAMSAAWEALVPGLAKDIAGDSRFTAADPKHNTLQAQEKAFGVLAEIIAKKIAAYQAYNKISLYDANSLFNNNLIRFYARYPIAEEGPDAGEWGGPFRVAMIDFVHRLLLEAQQKAVEAGHSLIRTRDAQQAVQNLTPHEVDEFEDVHFFIRLPPENRFSLESYDCDSFRDFGLHWRILHAGLDQTSLLKRAPDPFAAEIIAEAISQYGVLLCRAAGKLAEQQQVEYLRGVDFREGHQWLLRAAKQHHAMQDRSVTSAPVVSAKAEGAADTNTPFFSDTTSESNLAFLHRSSEWLSEFRRDIPASPPTFSGGGVAAEDFNGDGNVDLLFVGGNGNALLLNEGSGHFRDITVSAGLELKRPDGTYGEARQPLVVDFDNDGLRDILITYANDVHRIYRNLDGLTFKDVTLDSGLGGAGLIGGPATVFDFDNDGRLDVYLCYFGDYRNGAIPSSSRHNVNALPNKLFRNLGEMRFEDVTEASGVADTGWTQAVSHTDFDRDGRQDIIVANDFGRNSFFRNLGKGRFENAASSFGLNKAFHSMNVGIGELNQDNYPDVYISNIATLAKDSKYVNPGAETPLDFNEEHMATMLIQEYDVLYLSVVEQNRLAQYVPATNFQRGPTSTGWAWDAEFFDLDNDGDQDLYVVNGVNDYKFFSTVYKQKDKAGKTKFIRESHAQESNVVFINEDGEFKNRSLESGADFVGNSRSTAYLDIDRDGDLDVAVNNFHAPAILLRNNSEQRENNWIKVRLVGNPKKQTNRDAVGARLIAVTELGMTMTREIQCGSGYLSMNPKQQHFGLGKSDTIDLQIVWPNGETQKVEGLLANHVHEIRQRSSKVESTK